MRCENKFALMDYKHTKLGYIATFTTMQAAIDYMNQEFL